MGLPDIIEIVPSRREISASLTIPGSKSITNRALILAALSEAPVRIEGGLWSEDTQVMVDCLRHLGCDIAVSPEPVETSNRTLEVRRASGPFLKGGAAQEPLELFVGNAGTAARFLCAVACLGSGVFRLSGTPRMHERPQAELFRALRQLGYRIDTANDRLPAIVHGSGPKQGACTVSMEASSQFASALLLASGTGGWTVQVAGENEDEAPYVGMTRKLIESFQQHGATFEVEPDASSASYFLAADYLLGNRGTVRLARSPVTDWQVDSRFSRFLPLPATVSRSRDLGDSILTAMIVAAFSEHPVRFEELGRLRVQECDRVAAMRTELTRCGARVQEQGDCLTIHPSASQLHGAEIETYDDHRMAMCFAVLGLLVKGIRLHQPSCVRKTFPTFFQKLAAPAPSGMGVEIREGRSGRPLQNAELFAD